MSSHMTIQSYLGDYTVELYGSSESCTARKRVLHKLSLESFLIIDKTVSKLYPDIVDYWPDDLVSEIEALETNKELKTCEELLKKLVSNSFKKDMRLVVIGGGIIQDIAAFTASLLYRGVDWVFIPTTLLAQSDSCIGSKTSINFSGIKNLLGSFFPPRKIYCFLDFLETLSDDDIKSGIGEILHYYIVDNNAKSKDLMADYDNITSRRSLLEEHITESLSIKRKMIQVDEFDLKERRILNYGHTFGHAIEAISNFKVSHGQAVTLGMDIANFVAYFTGAITHKRFLGLREILVKNLPEYEVKSQNVDAFIELLKKDKKSTKGRIVCILPNEDVGVSIVSIGDIALLKSAILEYIRIYECEK